MWTIILFPFGATLAFFRPPNGAKNFPQKNRLGVAPFLQSARFYFHLFFNDDFRPNGVDAFAALILKNPRSTEIFFEKKVIHKICGKGCG